MMVQFDVKRLQKGTESFMVSFDFTKTPITQIADYIIIAASKNNASDIHFDPREDGMMVRFRIDGDCQDYTFIPKVYEKNLATRLKLLANMNITESRLPQDGAIKGIFGDTYLDMRVSALPLNEGEKIVVRILDYSRSLEGVDTLGFHPKNLEKVRRMMGIPNGIILTTGATGSGKSTTTYSILQELNKPETNIITVEDPIEMNIEGINQVQVNSEIGMTFAAALRSILRQDPNIILIGEIRDSETAQIAVRASITGHLVLSTIHTNNTLSTVERLLDMDVERYLLSSALSGIISQRLAKMLCPNCRYQRETTKYEKKVFKKYMNMDVALVWDANPKGCDQCRHGYHGRIAIHEVLELTDDIRAALSNEKMEKKDIAKLVYDGKTITMLQDALIKCLEGITSFEEVYRTIEIENEDDDNYEHEVATEIKNSIPKDPVVTTNDGLLEFSSKEIPGKAVNNSASSTVPVQNVSNVSNTVPVQNVSNASNTVPVQNVSNASNTVPVQNVSNASNTVPVQNVSNASNTVPVQNVSNASNTVPVQNQNQVPIVNPQVPIPAVKPNTLSVQAVSGSIANPLNNSQAQYISGTTTISNVPAAPIAAANTDAAVVVVSPYIQGLPQNSPNALSSPVSTVNSNGQMN